MYKQQNSFFIVSCLWRMAKPKHPAVTCLLWNNRPSYFCKIEHPARPRRRNPEKSSPHCSCPVSALSQAQLPEFRDLTQEISQLNYSSFSKKGSCRTQLPVWDLPEQPFQVQAECWLSCRVAGKGWKTVEKAGKGWKRLGKGCQQCPSALTTRFPFHELDVSEPVFPASVCCWV